MKRQQKEAPVMVEWEVRFRGVNKPLLVQAHQFVAGWHSEAADLGQLVTGEREAAYPVARFWCEVEGEKRSEEVAFIPMENVLAIMRRGPC